MGFDLIFKANVILAERAEKAISEFKAANYPDEPDPTGYGCLHLWRWDNPRLTVWTDQVVGRSVDHFMPSFDYVDPRGDGLIELSYEYDPEIFPDEGEAVLAWSEIAWPSLQGAYGLWRLRMLRL